MDTPGKVKMTEKKGFWPTVAAIVGAGAGFVAGLDLTIDCRDTVVVTGNEFSVAVSGDRNPADHNLPVTGKTEMRP